MSVKKDRKRIMRDLVIDEISTVDSPMQEGATMLLMKRAEGDPVGKRAALTTVVDGHSHLIGIDSYDGTRTSGRTESNGSGSDYHSHPWVMTEDDSIVLGEVNGHTHEVGTMSKAKKPRDDEDYTVGADVDEQETKPKGKKKPVRKDTTEGAPADPLDDGKPVGETSEDDMTTTQGAPASDESKATAEKKTAELEKKLARAERLAAMDDVQKSFMKGLPAAEQEAFLQLESPARTERIAKAAESNAVIYTGKDGSVFRKNDDPRLVAMAKRNDEQGEALAAATKKAVDSDLQKRAGELKHIPGDEATRVEMLRAVDAIPDEAMRKRALDALKAQDAALGAAFKRIGTSAAPTASSPMGRLQEMAKALIQKNASLTMEKALAMVSATPEGEAIYQEAFGTVPVTTGGGA